MLRSTTSIRIFEQKRVEFAILRKKKATISQFTHRVRETQGGNRLVLFKKLDEDAAMTDKKQEGEREPGATAEPKRTPAYKLHCRECQEQIFVPKKAMVQQDGIGKGRDLDGGWDAGRSQVQFKCPECAETIKLDGALSDYLGKWIFATTMPKE